MPRPPHITVINPAEAELIWQNTPLLLATLNGAGLGAWFWDTESGRIDCSRGALTLFGLDTDRPLSGPLNYLELIPEEKRPELRRRLVEILAGPPSDLSLRHRIRSPDGNLRWVEITGSPHQDATGRRQMIGVVRDVSRSQQHIEALRASEDKFSKLFISTPDAQIITERASDHLLDLNPSFERRFGWSRDEALGRTSSELGLWAIPQDQLRLLDLLQHDGRVEGLELELRDRHGAGSSNLLFGNEIILDGTPCIVLTMRDITQLRAQEQTLRANEEHLTLALQAADLGTWELHLSSRRLLCSPRAAQLLGHNGHDNLENPELALQLLPEASRQALADAYEQVLGQNSPEYRQVFQIPLPDGGTRHLETTARLYLGPDGKPQRLVGVLADISAQLLREQRLATSEEKFSTLFQTLSDPVCVLRVSDFTYIEVNSSFCETFGWSSEETIGNAFALLHDDEQRRQLQQQVREVGRVDNVEVSVQTKDGRLLSCLSPAATYRSTVNFASPPLSATSANKRWPRRLCAPARRNSPAPSTVAQMPSP